MRIPRLSYRGKLLGAFLAFAAVGCIGAVFGFTQILRLSENVRSSEEEISFHHQVRSFGFSVVNLNLLARRFALRGDFKDGHRFGVEYQKMVKVAAHCDSCHLKLKAAVRVSGMLDPFKSVTKFLKIANKNGPSDNKARFNTGGLGLENLVQKLEASTTAVQSALNKMDRRNTAKLAIHEQELQQVLSSTAKHLGLFLICAVVLAGAMAFRLSRDISGPVQRLIEGAVRIGRGDSSFRVPMAKDPDFAELTRLFNEMTSKVEERAQESARLRLLDRVISSQEEERKRISRELHDQICQELAVLLMAVRSCRGKTNGNGKNIETCLQKLIDDVRRMAWDLRPSVLSDHGLDAALSRYCNEVSERNGIQFDFLGARGVGGTDRLAENLEVVIYRVAQEAIANAVRHSNADRISVVLMLGNDEATLLVEDNGVGFDSNAVTRSDGAGCLGLTGMRERVTLVGGDLSITSSPLKGTSIRARIPLFHPEVEQSFQVESCKYVYS